MTGPRDLGLSYEGHSTTVVKMQFDAAEKAASFNYEETVKNLNRYYLIVKRQILRYQSPTTGLFPHDLSSPEKSHESHVRDSIYCASAVWSLSQSYKRIDDDKGKTHELSQSAVKCMRGILACWIRQADKVEKFKHNQSPKCALHSIFHMITGDPVTKDGEYEHLQIDCIALYLLHLVQMIQSGLQIIYTTDEVNFIQNLVFYVERAYRTPDYGMWERGSKYNNGSSELHASSIGMVKAALESINGENLFGCHGASWSVIYVDIDAHNRNRTIFDTILPRESASKNTDASLLCTISWPAFAIHEDTLIERTRDKAIRKLQGKYGFKRFLRDGYRTVLEDRNRKYYRPAEIKMFDGIECEWPLFYIYLIIDSVFRGDQAMVNHYQEKLKPLLKHTNDGVVVPKYYYVPRENIEAERANPGSQMRVSSGEGENGGLFLWGQAVYIISQLLVGGLLTIQELDPVGRRLAANKRPRTNARYSSFQSSPSDLVIQVALVAESVRLQQMLATYGIQTQTPHQIEPIEIWPPSQLVKIYEQLGVNNKLGLLGRPARPIGGLGTSKIYRAAGRTFICYPILFERSDFYLSMDMQFVIADVKNDLAFLAKCWKLAGRPTFCMILREDNIRGPNSRYIFDLLAQFKRGDCDGIRVRLGRLQEFISSSCIEHLDFMSTAPDVNVHLQPFMEKDMNKSFRSFTDIPKLVKMNSEETWIDHQEIDNKSTQDLIVILDQTDNMYAQGQILQKLLNREGLYRRIGNSTVEDRLEKLAQRAGTSLVWSVVRYCSSLLGKVVDSLAPSITAILVRGKQVTVGVFGHEEEVVDKPVSPNEIKGLLYARCYPHDVGQAVLQQELIICIGKLVSTNPELFHGILKIRIGWIVQAMKLDLNYGEEKERSIYSLSPSEIQYLLLRVLRRSSKDAEGRNPLWNRQLDGALNRVPKDFYDRVWQILEKTPGGLKVAGYHLPQQPTLSDMTQYELNFSLLVEQMLSKIIDPAYRQIMVETFMVVSTILERNKELTFQKPVDMDKLIQEAFEMFQHDRSVQAGEEKSDDMNKFFNTPPQVRQGTTSYLAKAVVNTLLEGEVISTSSEMCTLS